MPKRCTFLRLQVYERVVKSVISVCKKAQKGSQVHFIAVKKLRQSSFFMIYSYFKDSAFTAVKRVNAKFLTRYVKEVSFVNRRYSNGLPFLSKMVYKMVLGLDLGAEPEPEPEPEPV